MSSSMNLGDKPKNTVRSASYSNEEDQLLCHIYLDVSQNPITGINQSSLQFWSCIETEYNKALPVHITQVRPRRSLTSRMQVITAAIGKLRGCVRQIENLNPSGASEQDILDQAKALLAQDPNYKKGFRFDHVWPILKDTEKYSDINSIQTPSRRKRYDGKEPSESDSTTSKSAGASSFCIDLNADFDSQEPVNDINDNNDSIGRPIGRNKEKMKKKRGEEMMQFFKSMKQENTQIMGMFTHSATVMQKSQSLLQQNYELQLLRAQNEAKKLELRERRNEDKILLKDVDSIKDPRLRNALQSEQLRIYEKRVSDQYFQGRSGSSNAFSQYFYGNEERGNDPPNF